MFKLLRYLVLIAFFTGCSHHYSVTGTKPQHYDLKPLRADSATMRAIGPYKKKLDVEMQRVIAVSDEALTRDGYVPTLANFVMMAVDQYMKENEPSMHDSSVIFINRGGLRTNLPKGQVTVGNIFELMPFDNIIVILRLKGSKLRECIEASSKNGKLLGWNLSYTVTNSTPENILVFGKPLDDLQEYTIVTSDYLAGGGDDAVFFTKPLRYKNTQVKLRDAIISYCEYLTKNNQHIIPYSDERIRVSK